MSKLVILGAGGHATSVAEVALFNQPDRELLFVSADSEGSLFGFPIVKDLPDADEDTDYFVAVGNNQLRKKLQEELGVRNLTSIISNDAHISLEAVVSPQGAFVGHKAHIGPKAVIGKGAIINTHAVIDHESQVGEFSQVCPNANVAGRVKIGDNVFVGIGATIIDQLSVCSDVTIGAGAVVVKNIEEAGTYVGVPVRKVDGQSH